MSKFIDITGKRFGNLLVIKRAESKNKKTFWTCKCDCGNFIEVNTTKLKSGETKSCGCYRKYVTSTRMKKHGLSKTSLYNTWINMKTRCNNLNYNEFKNYGGKGVIICDEWKDFNNFMLWSINNGFSDKKNDKNRNILTLDRINNDGNYCPENCRWATYRQQGRNKSNNVKYLYNNKLCCLSELEEIASVKIDTIRRRLKEGWSIEDTINIPSKTYKGRLNYAK